MHNINLKNVVWKEGKYYVAWNLNTAVSSFGETREDALRSLKEALELHFEGISEKEIGVVERPGLVPFDLEYA